MTILTPDDWVDTTVGALASVKRGASPRPIASPRWFDASSAVGWVRITDVSKSNGRVLTETSQRLSADGIARSRYLQPGTLIMSIAATVGVPVVTGTPTCIHDGFVALENLKADTKFLFYRLKASEQDLRSAGQSGSQANVNTSIVKRLAVVVPSDRREQERIASVLSDADDLIDTLARLIAKKRDIKKGMMHELVTGKTRLSDFAGAWREARLADVSTLKGRIGWQGLTQKEFTSNALEPFLITGTNFQDGAIKWLEVYHVSEERYEIAPDIQLRSGDVLMTKDGTIGKLLYVDQIPSPGKATLNSHLLLFRPKGDSYDPRFLYYQLGSPRFASHIEENKSGTTFFGISQASVGNYQVLLPPVDEQRAIGAALAAVDDEIDALERHLTSSRAIKQGMMQELLTGRTRLPVEGVTT
jgi:type I restriction enzyme S subunit